MGVRRPDPDNWEPPGLAATVALYTLARLAVVALIAVVLTLVGVPFVIAALVGLVVALPLSMVLFRGLRLRLDDALAEAGRRRSTERAALRARLRGEDPQSDEPPGGEPPGGEPQAPSEQGAERQSDAAGS